MQIWINIALTFRANRLDHNIIKINKMNTVRNYIDRTLEIIDFEGDTVKYVGRKASSSTATGNLNKHLAQQKEILEKILRN